MDSRRRAGLAAGDATVSVASLEAQASGGVGGVNAKPTVESPVSAQNVLIALIVLGFVGLLTVSVEEHVVYVESENDNTVVAATMGVGGGGGNADAVAVQFSRPDPHVRQQAVQRQHDQHESQGTSDSTDDSSDWAVKAHLIGEGAPGVQHGWNDPEPGAPLYEDTLTWADGCLNMYYGRPTRVKQVCPTYDSGARTPCFVANGKTLCLPSFMLVGVQKCATSSLYYDIVDHPDTVVSPRKEPQYFGNLSRWMSLYHYLNRIYLPEDRDAIALDPTKMLGEGSAQTFWNRATNAELLYRINPRMRIIVMFREPVSRTESDFWYFCSTKFDCPQDSYSFTGSIDAQLFTLFEQKTCLTERAVPREPFPLGAGCEDRHGSFRLLERYDFDMDCLLPRVKNPGKEGKIRGRTFLGFYGLFLRYWTAVFPREQILVWENRDLIRDPNAVVHRTYEFLGLRPIAVEKFREENVLQKEHPDMLPRTRALLQDMFRPWNCLLAHELDETYPLLWNWEYDNAAAAADARANGVEPQPDLLSQYRFGKYASR